MADLDWSQCPDVESIPGKVSGASVLKGTRMSVSAIFENIAAGANIDDIVEWFDGLHREQVKAVIELPRPIAASSLKKQRWARASSECSVRHMRIRWTLPAAEDFESIRNYLEQHPPHLLRKSCEPSTSAFDRSRTLRNAAGPAVVPARAS